MQLTRRTVRSGPKDLVDSRKSKGEGIDVEATGLTRTVNGGTRWRFVVPVQGSREEGEAGRGFEGEMEVDRRTVSGQRDIQDTTTPESRRGRESTIVPVPARPSTMSTFPLKKMWRSRRRGGGGGGSKREAAQG